VLLALVSLSHAAEIGTDLKLGVGGATGDTFISATGKYWAGQRFGASAYLGTSFVIQRLRVNAELDLLKLSEFEFGDVSLYGLVGIDAALGTTYGVNPELGAGLGAGLALRFSQFPGEAFLDAGAGGYPVCATYFWSWCHVQPRGELGFRWYIL
jgi:hypothetical protein